MIIAALRKNAWLRNAVLLAGSLAVMEIALRLAGLLYDRSRPYVFEAAGEPALKVMCVGDSYTYGGNVRWGEAYPYKLWQELRAERVTVVNRGRCEYNSGQVLAELPRELDEHKPGWLLVLVGASDKWNLIGCGPKGGFEVCRRDYDKYSPLRPAEVFPESLRVWQLLRGLYLDTRLKRALEIAGAGRPLELDKVGQAKVAHELLADLVYASRYEEALQLSLAALAGLNSGSRYFSEDLSYYFALAASFEFQSKYSSDYVAGRLRGMQASNPGFAGNDVFQGYLAHFERRAEFERAMAARLERNLAEIAAEASRRGVRLAVLNYPSDYAAANAALRRLAAANKAVFVDVNAAMGELIRRDGRARYLMGDDHATPEGHRVMAALAAKALREAAR